MVGLQRAGQLLRHRGDLVARLLARQTGVQVDALAAAGDRHRAQSHAGEDGPGPFRDSRAVGQTHARTRVQVEHEPVRREPGTVGPESPLGRVKLQARDLRQVRECSDLLHDGVVLRARGVRDRHAGEPCGRARLQVLDEERCARSLSGPDTVRPALAGDRAIPQMGQEHRCDRRVVADDVRLGGAGLRVEHLVQSRQPQRASADADGLLLIGHGTHTAPAPSLRVVGSSAPMTPSGLRRPGCKPLAARHPGSVYWLP